MTRKETWFAAFASLEKQGVKLRDITAEQMCTEMKVIGLDRHLFHQYRYLYRQETEIAE